MVQLITRAELENFARIFHVPLRDGEDEKVLRLRILATMNAPAGQRPKDAPHFEQIARLGIWRSAGDQRGMYGGMGDDALLARGEILLTERRARRS